MTNGGFAASEGSPRVGYAMRFLAVAATYWALGKLVFLAASVGANVALIWPSAGIGLVALLWWGYGCAPAIWVGALAVGLDNGLPPVAAGAIALGNTLGPLTAAVLLRRFEFRPDFARRRDLGAFLLIAVGLLPLPAALIGPLALCSATSMPCSAAPGVAAVWWMGDSLGVLITAPVLLGRPREWWRAMKSEGLVLESLGALGATVVTSSFVFFASAPIPGGPSLPLPFALWAAVRLRRFGAGLAVLLIAAPAIVGGARALGPFALADGPAPLWPYLTIVALVSFVVSTLIAERDAAIGRLQSTEQLARSAVDAASDAIFLADETGRHLDANRAAVALLGYDRADLRQRNLEELVAPEERPRIAPALAELGTGDRVTGEWRLRRRDGTDIWAEISATKLPDGRLQAIVRDVTQRHQAETALRVSEARYRAIVETEPECVKVIGAAGELLEMNPAGLAMIEAESLAEVRGRPLIDLVTPDHREAFARLHTRVMAGETGELLFQIVGRRGAIRWLHTTAAPLRDESGRPAALLGVTRDITRLKEVDDARISETRRAEALVRALGEVVYDWDLAADRLTWSGRYQDVLGGAKPEPESSTAAQWLARIHPEDVEGVIAAVRGARNTTGLFDREYRVRRADGVHVWVHDRGVFRPEGGRSDRAIGVLRDVTESVAARARMERLAAFPELSPAAVIEFSPSGEVTYWNRAADAMAREANLDSVVGLLPADHPRVVRECRESGEGRHRVEHSTGGQTFSASFLPIGVGGSVHCYVSDVTRELELRSHMEQSQRMESIGRLAGGIAHDFNNILQVITGFGTLATDPDTTAAERESNLRQVLVAADRAAQLTRQLLAFSRRQPLRMVDTDLNDCVSTAVGMVRRLIEAHITVDFIPGYQLANVHADRGQIEQVLLNLCINARDAMPDGGRLTLETENVLINGAYRASHPWATAGRYVLISVTDTGAGMEREVLDRIFEPFFTTKAPDRGTGLGLAVAYGIIEQHGGMINVYSEPGVGTTFKIYLPSVERLASAVDSKVRPAPPRGTETVLLAEDDSQVRRLTAEILERAGYVVIAARDGGDAVTLFAKHADRIALVLLDLVMPGLGGTEAYERIRAIRSDVPVIFASGYAGPGVSPTFVADRGMTLLEKPFDPDRLLREVRAAIDDRRRGLSADRPGP